MPQLGRLASELLDLDLVLEGQRLRFYHANAELLTSRDLSAKLGAMVEEIAAERDAESERARVESERAAAAEEELARLRAELEALRRRS